MRSLSPNDLATLRFDAQQLATLRALGEYKPAAAARRCKHASDHAASVGSEAWRYLLVPHDDIAESKQLNDFLRFEVKG